MCSRLHFAHCTITVLLQAACAGTCTPPELPVPRAGTRCWQQTVASARSLAHPAGELLSMQELALRERLYLSASPPLLYLWTESEDGGLAPSLALQDVQPSGARRARLRAAEDAAQPLAIDATFVGGVTRLMCGCMLRGCMILCIQNARLHSTLCLRPRSHCARSLLLCALSSAATVHARVLAETTRVSPTASQSRHAWVAAAAASLLTVAPARACLSCL